MSSNFPRKAALPPRLLWHGLVWFLAALVLGEVVPVLWFLAAFPAAAGLVFLLLFFHVRGVLALGVLAGTPWLIRGLVFLADLFFSPGGDFLLLFDQAWYLMAVNWYFTTLLLFFFTRYPRGVMVEVLLLGGAALLLILAVREGGFSFTPPRLAGIQSLLALLVLVLGGWVFAGSSWRPGGGPGGGVLYLMLLLVLGFLLFFFTLGIRKNRSLAQGGGVLESGLFHFNFSEVLSLEPEINLSPELILLYREEGVPQRRYLRHSTLSGWDPRQGFFGDGKKEMTAPGYAVPPGRLPRRPRVWEEPEFKGREALWQEYFLVALDPSSFLALDYPVSVEPWVIWDNASFVRAYGTESQVSLAQPWELGEAGIGGWDPETYAYFTAGGEDPFYQELAREAAGEAQGYWEQAKALEQWLQREYTYSLRPGTAPDGDQLKWFLTQGKRGYCSYFAFAMTRMARALGLPARVGVGFFTDPETAVLGFIPVRGDQAHAWTEIWFEEYGWITFDPTSPVMTPGEDYPLGSLSQEQWLPFIEEVLTRRGEAAPLPLGEEAPPPGSLWRNSGVFRPSAVLGLLFLLGLLLYLPGRILPLAALLVGRMVSDRRRRVKNAWKAAEYRLGRGGFLRKSGETLLDWSRRVDREAGLALESWAVLVLKAMYAPRFEKEDGLEAQRAGRRHERAWKTLPLSRRLRAAFSLGFRRVGAS